MAGIGSDNPAIESIDLGGREVCSPPANLHSGRSIKIKNVIAPSEEAYVSAGAD